MEEDKVAQNEEIETLRSIYLEEEFIASQGELGDWKIDAIIQVEVPQGYQVRYISDFKNETSSLLKVDYLPPIRMTLYLQGNYPSTQGPKYVLRCNWLSKKQISMLMRSLRSLWKDNAGFPIVYTWFEHLKTETLSIIGMTDELDLTKMSKAYLMSQMPQQSVPDVPQRSSSRETKENKRQRDPVNIVNIIQTYNLEQEKKNFAKAYHQCEICFTEKRGIDSIMFKPCSHIFCRECLKNYFTVLVNEGSSCAVKCPAYKCESEVRQHQVREVLPTELFEKYDKALLSTMLDTMSDIMYCPRSVCQYPVTCVPEDRVGVCPHCQFAFCVFCRMVYHGVEPCKVKSDERKKIVDTYQNASEEDKLILEARYGRKQLQNFVANTLSECWIQTNGKNCPRCNVVIEKIDGCNKMTCNKCQAFFCWLCGKLLVGPDPYLHYTNSGSCQNRLFFEDGDEEDDDDAMWWMPRGGDGFDSGSEDMEGADTDDDDDYDEGFYLA